MEESKVIDESRQGEATMIKSAVPGGRKLLLESYGCAMNFSDSEIIASIMGEAGFTTTNDPVEADVVMMKSKEFAIA
jgi:tRNA-2-methylthio-N6-dimethylallyladenosine synthase